MRYSNCIAWVMNHNIKISRDELVQSYGLLAQLQTIKPWHGLTCTGVNRVLVYKLHKAVLYF